MNNVFESRVNEEEKMRGDIFAGISHELKTPINVINSALQVIKDKRAMGEDEDKYLDMIKRNCYRLNRIIYNLIDISRYETGEAGLKKENCEIIKHIKEWVKDISVFARERNVVVHFISSVEHLEVSVDLDKIGRIIANLMANAVKFSKDGGGSVTLSVDAADNNLIIAVKDDGIGISEKNLDFIFQRFARVDNSSVKYEGSGLGLWLVKNLVNMHHGSITAESREGVGSKFTVYIPVTLDRYISRQAKAEYKPNPDIIRNEFMY